jgi:hypothetical protein
MKYDIFLICPVRDAQPEQKKRMEEYIAKLESQGKTVYYPARDTNQIDSIGYRICTDNKNALLNSKEVHIFYDKTSQGSLFDLGMAFGSDKPLYIVNINDIVKTEGKSFANMIIEWNKK